jgi:pimeloyl-ACP methyl ester carboxylesterase
MAIALAAGYEGSRARLPDEEGYIERDGVHVHWERYGNSRHTILFLPTWSIVHSRIWRNQIAYFAREFRVVVFDGRGNGKSDRPLDPAAYAPHEFVADALAVMDASDTEQATVVSLSMSTIWNLLLTALHPDRVNAAAFVGPTPYAVSDPFPEWSLQPFNERFDSYEGFQGQNRWFILEHYEEFVGYWTRLVTAERHSTRAIEFGIGMALETSPEVIVATLDAGAGHDYYCTADRLRQAGQALRPVARQLRCPVVVIGGALDAIALPHWASALADDTSGEFVLIEDAAHHPGGRKPVRFNLELRHFVEQVAART